MKFKTYPTKHTDIINIEIGDTRPLLHRLFNIGIREPKQREQIYGRTTFTPFEIIGWPYQMGEKIHHIKLDGYDLYGMFAIEKLEDVFTCVCDYYEKN